MKYKNKDGIELNFGSMGEAGRKGSGVELIQEVICEAISILNKSKQDDIVVETIDFLKENFDIKTTEDYVNV